MGTALPTGLAFWLIAVRWPEDGRRVAPHTGRIAAFLTRASCFGGCSRRCPGSNINELSIVTQGQFARLVRVQVVQITGTRIWRRARGDAFNDHDGPLCPWRKACDVSGGADGGRRPCLIRHRMDDDENWLTMSRKRSQCGPEETAAT